MVYVRRAWLLTACGGKARRQVLGLAGETCIQTLQHLWRHLNVSTVSTELTYPLPQA